MARVSVFICLYLALALWRSTCNTCFEWTQLTKSTAVLLTKFCSPLFESVNWKNVTLTVIVFASSPLSVRCSCVWSHLAKRNDDLSQRVYNCQDTWIRELDSNCIRHMNRFLVGLTCSLLVLVYCTFLFCWWINRVELAL